MPRPLSRLPRYSTALLVLLVMLAFATSLAIAAFMHFLLPQWKLIAAALFCLLGAACAAKIGSAFDYRRWRGFRNATAIAFLMLTLILTSSALFYGALSAHVDSSDASLLSGIPIIFIALVFEVARRLSRK
ncbi:MAG: hypothetical protein ACXVA4_01400 [Ktedonobacterales bacterium]